MTDYGKTLKLMGNIPVNDLTGGELTTLGKMLFALGEQKLQEELREQLLREGIEERLSKESN